MPAPGIYKQIRESYITVIVPCPRPATKIAAVR